MERNKFNPQKVVIYATVTIVHMICIFGFKKTAISMGSFSDILEIRRISQE